MHGTDWRWLLGGGGSQETYREAGEEAARKAKETLEGATEDEYARVSQASTPKASSGLRDWPQPGA